MHSLCSRLRTVTPSHAALMSSHAALTIPRGSARAPPRASGCSEQLRLLFFKAACTKLELIKEEAKDAIIRCPICFNLPESILDFFEVICKNYFNHEHIV